MEKLKLFFSWQSDIVGNHKNIRDSLLAACAEIRSEGCFDIEYTESTLGISGSPVIEKAVVDNILSCNIFVADLTPIDGTTRKDIPNPNVMMELGYAKANMSDDVILLLNTKQTDALRMPFDINHNRMTKFPNKELVDFVRSMADTAVRNPKLRSIFDNKDNFIHHKKNVDKNIASGKYLPKVFLEDLEIKQCLRDFVAPRTFCKLVLDRCELIDIYSLNHYRRIEHKPEVEFNVSEYRNAVAEPELSDFYRKSKLLQDYLYKKYDEAVERKTEYSLRSNKFGELYTHLNYVNGKILTVLSSAGQGKTNLVCDLVENVLLKRGIPFVYLNGYEIEANDIGQAFAKAMMPLGNKALDEILPELATYCRRRRGPVILIIDGLNENASPEVFSRNLETFLEAVLQCDCIKVLLTCRTDYYNECFSSLDSVFSDRMVKIENLNHRLSDEEKDQLLDNYLTYFNIKANLADVVKKNLVENFLLLRIFCEAHKDKSLGPVHTINKESLFAQYYEQMKNNLIDKVKREENQVLYDHQISAFIEIILKYMVDNNQFFNIPLSYIQGKLSSEECRIFTRFLDENILLRKDLQPESKGIYSHKEVVNFTYDGFRDYLLSAFLSDVISQEDEAKYENAVREYTTEKHQLREGLSQFLFVHSKCNKQHRLDKILKTFDWYMNVFEVNIWDIEEEKLTTEDIERVLELLSSQEPRYTAHRLIFYGRWNEDKYKKLNIRILLDYMSTLNDSALSEFLERVWPQKWVSGWYGKEGILERRKMLEVIDKLLANEKMCSYDSFHNIFELLLYMLPYSESYALEVFMKYWSKYSNKVMLKRVKEVAQSKQVLYIIQSLV